MRFHLMTLYDFKLVFQTIVLCVKLFYEEKWLALLSVSVTTLQFNIMFFPNFQHWLGFSNKIKQLHINTLRKLSHLAPGEVGWQQCLVKQGNAACLWNTYI